MRHRQKMNDKQRLVFDVNSYKAKLKANKGHNYQYYSDDFGVKWVLEKKYKLYDFKVEGKDFFDRWATQSESLAVGIALCLRQEGNYARVIVGYSKNVQKIKMFSVIYKAK